MIHRGRKTPDEVVSLVPLKPLPAPRGTTPAERRVWKQITGSFAPTFFSAVDEPLLLTYVQSAVLADTFAKALDLDGVLLKRGDKTTVNPALYAFNAAVASMCRLAGKLRIAPSSRYRADVAATRASTTPNTRRPWEKMR